MSAYIQVNVEPSTPRDAVLMLIVAIEYLVCVIRDAEAVLEEEKIIPAEVDPAADTREARIVAFLSLAETLYEIEESVEYIRNNIGNNLPSPSDLEKNEVDE